MSLNRLRNDTARKYRSSGSLPCHRNCIHFNSGNRLEHELKKAKICYEALKAGQEFITEAIDRKTGLRRDIVILDTGEIVELSFKNLNPKNLQEYKENPDVVVIKVEEDRCPVCNGSYIHD